MAAKRQGTSRSGEAPTPFGPRQEDGYALGPLYSHNTKESLGGDTVAGPTKGPSINDPLGYTKFPKGNVGGGRGKKKGK